MKIAIPVLATKLRRLAFRTIALLFQGLKSALPTLVKLGSCWVLAYIFAGGIAESYHLPRPSWSVCLNAIFLLEIAGQILRGKVRYYFSQD